MSQPPNLNDYQRDQILARRRQEHRMVRDAFRHMLSGAAAGILFGAIGYLMIASNVVALETVPAVLGIVALFEAALAGALIGLGVFLVRIRSSRSDA